MTQCDKVVWVISATFLFGYNVANAQIGSSRPVALTSIPVATKDNKMYLVTFFCWVRHGFDEAVWVAFDVSRNVAFSVGWAIPVDPVASYGTITHTV